MKNGKWARSWEVQEGESVGERYGDCIADRSSSINNYSNNAYFSGVLLKRNQIYLKLAMFALDQCQNLIIIRIVQWHGPTFFWTNISSACNIMFCVLCKDFMNLWWILKSNRCCFWFFWKAGFIKNYLALLSKFYFVV